MRYELNAQIAERLRLMADLLAQQGANGFRVAAYRRAAETIDALDTPLDALLAKGRAELVALPTIGESIAAAIAEMASTGRWAQLERLTGALDAESLFRSIPGVGPKLAARLHGELGLDTLEQLEIAAHDGRLESAPGIGPRRAAAIRLALSERLGRRRIRRRGAAAPPVGLLLAVDSAYRRAADAGKLHRIAPTRFNPSGEAWLPIMHQDRRRWHFTALYSNTARAHDLEKTHDWVVLYFHTDASPESQCTVVTETHGPLKGKRVVRGREAECAAYYDAPRDSGDRPADQEEPRGGPRPPIQGDECA